MTAIGLGLAMPFVAMMGARYSAEASALFARFATSPTPARATLINDLIVALKTAGVWTKLDAFYVLAAADSQAARQNWVANQYNLSAVSAPTFTADQGYQGDGATSYLETSFNPTTAVSPKFLQNSGHMSFHSRTAAQGAGVDMGNGNSLILVRSAGDVTSHRINAGASGTKANVSGLGHYLTTRLAGGVGDNLHYKNGVDTVAGSNASAAPDNAAIRILSRSTSPSFSARQCAASSIGGGLTSGEVAALYAAVAAYLTAVGAL